MFNKKEPVKTGPSFPFYENDKDGIKIRFDSISIDKQDDKLTITFVRDGLKLYAYTYDVRGNNYTVDFNDIEGIVAINMQVSS